MSGNEAVKVIVRVRPMDSKEVNQNCHDIIKVHNEQNMVEISNPKEPDHEPKAFTFDRTYDQNSIQGQIYDDVAFPLVQSVLSGFNGTIFAYGQTGCGKTYTMVGKNDAPELFGIIPNSFNQIFGHIDNKQSNVEFLIRVTFLEIYNENIRDLLEPSRVNLELKESSSSGIYVQGLTQEIVSNIKQITSVMDIGNRHRTTGSTQMNSQSSRSHSIFTVIIECNEKDQSGKDHFTVGKLNLVDLAGSERLSKTGATGERLIEGCKINLSLSALGNVISALVSGKGRHIPYRDSKLTRLLQDSLGGNTKTVMCANISPADYNYEETLSTLRYANRAKNIKNKPVINEDPKDALLRQYKDEIERLMELLSHQNSGIPINLENQLKQNNRQLDQVPETVYIDGPNDDNYNDKKKNVVLDFISLSLVPSSNIISVNASSNIIDSDPSTVFSFSDHPKTAPDRQFNNDNNMNGRRVQSSNLIDKIGRTYNSSSCFPGESCNFDEDSKLDCYNKDLINEIEELKSDLMNNKNKVDELNDIISQQKRQIQQYVTMLKEKEQEKLDILDKEEKSRKLAEGVDKLVEKRNDDNSGDNDHKIRKLQDSLARRNKRIKVLEQDLQDREDEFEKDKQDLLEIVRNTNQDLLFFETIVSKLITKSELTRIYDNSKYDLENNSWSLPIIKPRKEFQDLKLPQLKINNSNNNNTKNTTKHPDTTISTSTNLKLPSLQSASEKSSHKTKKIIDNSPVLHSVPPLNKNRRDTSTIIPDFDDDF